MKFDPNSAAAPDSGIFGLPSDASTSSLVLIPVPWDATTSFHDGTSRGPKAMLEASHQLDLMDRKLGRFYERGIHLLEVSKEIEGWNTEAKKSAKLHRATGSDESSHSKTVNTLSERLNQWVLSETHTQLKRGKRVGILGGDHSVPFGAIQAAAETFGEIGILHIDAHFDLRAGYESFAHSHASIFYNVMSAIPQVKKLVQVGIRDFSEQELEFSRSLGHRTKVFFDSDFAQHKVEGGTFAQWAAQIVGQLPRKVWVSFDIDGLDPTLCPSTGTPVPGGLSFHEAQYLLQSVFDSSIEVIGFDLCEVGDQAWDANVGMRLLYKLCGYTLLSSRPS